MNDDGASRTRLIAASVSASADLEELQFIGVRLLFVPSHGCLPRISCRSRLSRRWLPASTYHRPRLHRGRDMRLEAFASTERTGNPKLIAAYEVIDRSPKKSLPVSQLEPQQRRLKPGLY
jgi:hypothetical protein